MLLDGKLPIHQELNINVIKASGSIGSSANFCRLHFVGFCLGRANGEGGGDISAGVSVSVA